VTTHVATASYENVHRAVLSPTPVSVCAPDCRQCKQQSTRTALRVARCTLALSRACCIWHGPLSNSQL